MSRWTRHGECNHCGHCCEHFSRAPLVRALEDVDDVAFYRARGFEDTVIEDTPHLARWGWVFAPCPQHGEGRCRIHDTRPQTCRDFPTRPQDVVGTPCSYWFSDGRYRMGGGGSLFPATEAELMAVEG